jgi:hypothetical protein
MSDSGKSVPEIHLLTARPHKPLPKLTLHFVSQKLFNSVEEYSFSKY